MQYVIMPGTGDQLAQAGGKASALAQLQDPDLLIPAWFALSPRACRDSLGQAGQIGGAGLADFWPAAQVQAELALALAWLCPNGEPVAVRSSALDEDGQHHSFAGQLDSFLFVRPEEVSGRVVDVWRSAFSQRALAYRREHGLPPEPQPPAVLIQRMVNPQAAGVAFSADPVSGRRGVAVVSAVAGSGESLVSGQQNGQTYRVNRAGQILWRDTAAEPTALDDEQVGAVAALARRVERLAGRPQDIEWALEDGRLYLLQARPITALADLADPDGTLNLWDNSNIAESYPGLTTPLTFSFARRAYEEVYRQFCRMMGVPAAVIDERADVFRQMLGLVRGRIYYNLLNWYRVLALLPGFTFNRRFMEQMMGVKESLPAEALAESTSQPARIARLRDGLRLVRTAAGLGINYVLLPRRITAFYGRLAQALGPGRPDLAPLRPDELAARYRDLERQLLTRWDAPLVNDFFAMIFYGLLRRLAEKWCSDSQGSLAHELLSGGVGIISAEPAAHLRRLAAVAAQEQELVALLNQGSTAEITAGLVRFPEFAGLYRDYLEKFGDRCLEELKLESLTLHENPLPLLRAVGRLAAAGEPAPAATGAPAGPARSLVNQALAGYPLRRLVFNWVLSNARARLRDRENLRFERTRLFGRVRLILAEMGRKFRAMDLLAEARDVFYLEVEEALGFVEGTTTCTDLAGLVAVRKAEFDRCRAMEAPPGRFETRGAVHDNRMLGQGQTAGAAPAGEQRQGLGCCPGLVRGPVRLVSDPRQAAPQPGEILVAERTDPGWVMLFPAAAGLLVEYGSLLSHTAIVARELGLPAVVSLPGVTGWLKDGDWVELDGSRGLVTRLAPAGAVEIGELRYEGAE